MGEVARALPAHDSEHVPSPAVSGCNALAPSRQGNVDNRADDVFWRCPLGPIAWDHLHEGDDERVQCM